MSKIDISQLRREFNSGSFSAKNADKSPFKQFDKWLTDSETAGFLDPNAVTVATVDENGMPSMRVVLLKSFDERGFVFYTNYESKKGREMERSPLASMLFFWDKLERQIRIEGKIEKVSAEESDAYFKTRSHTSKVGAWASKQSEPLSSRNKLMAEAALLMAKYPINVPRPPHWGGYRLIPEYFEFWQGRESRLHDRIIYELDGEEWKISRLYP